MNKKKDKINRVLSAALLSVCVLIASPSVLAAEQSSVQTSAITAQSQVIAQAATTNPTGNKTSDSILKSGVVTCGKEPGTLCNLYDLINLFGRVINFAIGLAAFVAVLFVIKSGFMFFAAGRSGNEGEAKKARGGIVAAIGGFVIVMFAFTVVNTFLSGSFSLGIKNGAHILTSPLDYIRGK